MYLAFNLIIEDIIIGTKTDSINQMIRHLFNKVIVGVSLKRLVAA